MVSPYVPSCHELAISLPRARVGGTLEKRADRGCHAGAITNCRGPARGGRSLRRSALLLRCGCAPIFIPEAGQGSDQVGVAGVCHERFLEKRDRGISTAHRVERHAVDIGKPGVTWFQNRRTFELCEGFALAPQTNQREPEGMVKDSALG